MMKSKLWFGLTGDIGKIEKKGGLFSFVELLSRLRASPQTGFSIVCPKESSKITFILLLGILMLWGCQFSDGKEVAPANEIDYRQEFKSFYADFHRDSLYQIAHIQFPLQGVSSNPTDHHAGFRWQRADWRIHRLFDEAETGFRSQFTWLGDDFVIERIEHRNGYYGMERRFSRLSGDDWYLIYYAALHPLQ